jgi:hypothetical protein
MVAFGGLPIAHDDVEDFEGGPGVDGVQWIGRKGVKGLYLFLIFLLGILLPSLISRWPSASGTGQQNSLTAFPDNCCTFLTYILIPFI